MRFTIIISLLAAWASVSSAAPAPVIDSTVALVRGQPDVTERDPSKLVVRTYAASCVNCYIGNGDSLVCFCAMLDGRSQTAWFTLGGYVGNSNGRLVWGRLVLEEGFWGHSLHIWNDFKCLLVLAD
jgi:hypothetical protein